MSGPRHWWRPTRRRNKPDPRMATDLGDALTAYWRSGKWWGSPDFIRWLVDTGQLAKADYALRALDTPNLSEEGRYALQGAERKLLKALADSARPAADPVGGQVNGSAPP
ncbi:hypothetical protein [Planomonospora algeriensis]